MILFKTYRHKKQILFTFSAPVLSSRYVVPCSLPLVSPKDIEVILRNRELRVRLTISVQWIALVTDAGMYFRKVLSTDTVASFILQNEQPVLILIGINEQKVLSYPLFSNN